MSGFSSATTTFSQPMATLNRDEPGRDDSDEQAFVPEPGRGIALGVFLSVPLWLLLAWTVHAVG
jgi:hypothetical protein